MLIFDGVGLKGQYNSFALFYPSLLWVLVLMLTNDCAERRKGKLKMSIEHAISAPSFLA